MHNYSVALTRHIVDTVEFSLPIRYPRKGGGGGTRFFIFIRMLIFLPEPGHSYVLIKFKLPIFLEYSSDH